MTSSAGSVYVTGGAKFEFLSLLFGYSHIGNNNIIVYVLILGDPNKTFINFVAIFLNIWMSTIFWINPGSWMHKFMNVHKFKNCAMNRK